MLKERLTNGCHGGSLVLEKGAGSRGGGPWTLCLPICWEGGRVIKNASAERGGTERGERGGDRSSMVESDRRGKKVDFLRSEGGGGRGSERRSLGEEVPANSDSEAGGMMS